jgi:hypothetical protein
MQSIELDSQTTLGNAMVFKEQKKHCHMHNLHIVEVFLDLEASKSCDQFNVGEDKQDVLMIGSFDDT